MNSDINSGPLTSFELFPLLPIEIRLMIVSELFPKLNYQINCSKWRCTTLHPRIIEIQDELQPDGIIARFGYTATITAASSKPPAMLHVNKEARTEGLKFYTLRVFCTSRRICRLVYFNNPIDILLFGKGCRAPGLMKKVFQQGTTVDVPVERIAIAMEEVTSHEKLLKMMREIHGLPGGPGCVGVKEITFVPPTKLWGCQPGNIDRRWTLVSTANGGLSYHHISIRRIIEQSIRVLETTTTGVFDQRLSEWVRTTDDSKPVFRYASLRPVGGEGNKTRDGINVSGDELRKLTRHDSYILKMFQDMYGIEIKTPVTTSSRTGNGETSSLYGPPNRCREIGIVGKNRFQVEKGLDAIKQYLVKIQTLGPEKLK